MNGLRLLAIGDTHFKVSNLAETKEMANRIIRTVQDRQIPYVVFLGDLHDDFERIHSSVLTAIEDMIRPLSEICQVYIIIGNHDLVNNSVFMEPKHPFNGFKNWKNVTVIDKATNVFIEGLQFTMCPYVPVGRFLEALATAPGWERSKAIFCHQEFKNSKLSSIPSVKGDEWPLNYPLVIGGHIHDYDMLQPNILLIGTPLAQSHGESNDKTISLFGFSENIHHERISLDLPKKITFTLSIEEAKVFFVPDNTIARVHLVDKQSDILAFKKTKEYKELEKKAKVIPKPNDISEHVVTKNRTNYLEIMKQECSKYGPEVMEALQDIINEN